MSTESFAQIVRLEKPYGRCEGPGRGEPCDGGTTIGRARRARYSETITGRLMCATCANKAKQ